MSTVLITQRFAIKDEEGNSHLFTPSQAPQPTTNALIAHPYFQAAIKSGWAKVIDQVDEEAGTPETPEPSADYQRGFADGVASATAGLMHSRQTMTMLTQAQQDAGQPATEVEAEAPGSGSERWGGGDWTEAGMDKDGFPVSKGSADDMTTGKAETPGPETASKKADSDKPSPLPADKVTPAADQNAPPADKGKANKGA